MNADIARERNRIEASLKILAPSRVKAIDAEYQQYGRLIGMRTSPAEENAKMLGEIEGLASQASVVLNGTKPREPKAREYYEEYPVEIEVEGEWAGIAGFLYGLQHSPQLLKVQDLTLSPKARETPSVVKGAILVTKVVGL
jgi:Tfp pilus assembly protein PilO